MLSLLTSSLLAIALPSGIDGSSPLHTIDTLSSADTTVVIATDPQGGTFIPGKDRTDPIGGRGGPVPEPATMLLVGSGALGAAYVARRRRKKVGVESEPAS